MKHDEPEFDPVTCVTVKELRERGFSSIPADLPDCAWIPRDSVEFEFFNETTPQDAEKGLMKAGMRATFTEPFRWIELNYKTRSGIGKTK
jgi:hypothetical protein